MHVENSTSDHHYKYFNESEYSININGKNENALIFASNINHIEADAKYCNSLCDIHLKNNEGKSVLDLAHELDNKDHKVYTESNTKYYHKMHNYLMPYSNNNYSNYK
ncbi:hypothetical protein H8356DRAFT_1423279 [Neocallimastix lanati (nom. inval.)]|nr:hypothetical protein H8356DRAFT_1423279 [Neocallimastix sp. JGI-2020a]